MADGSKTCILVGSPHRGGRSERLADALALELESRGADACLWKLSERPIEPCFNCGVCLKTGECSLKGDAFTELAGTLFDSKLVFIVAPVYFAGPAACLKAAIDRLQVFWARKYVLKASLPAPRIASLFVLGEGGDPHGCEPLERICSSSFNCANVRIDGRIHRFIGDATDELEHVPQLLDNALTEAQIR